MNNQTFKDLQHVDNVETMVTTMSTIYITRAKKGSIAKVEFFVKDMEINITDTAQIWLYKRYEFYTDDSPLLMSQIYMKEYEILQGLKNNLEGMGFPIWQRF